MSLKNISDYYNYVDKMKKYGGSKNESAIKIAFLKLIEDYCAGTFLILVPELDYVTFLNTTVNPDATIKDALRQDWGYWESKDEFDTLDEEIRIKLEKGYPSTNILFEDGITAVLIQEGKELRRVRITDAKKLDETLTKFVSYQPLEARQFMAAVEKFKTDLPDLLVVLRDFIDEQSRKNESYIHARDEFFELCKEVINPSISLEDIREMVIQHILTEEIFLTVFNESQYIKENNIAIELSELIETFFKGEIRRNLLSKIDNYYKVIKAAASKVSNHHEKQRFLKVLYEQFYRAYDPDGADRLGIFYTPEEVVRFMVDGTENLLFKKFNRLLGDKNIEILDPAVGTGTFVTELIEHIPTDYLENKYTEEIFCNEVAILPYYIANLNIEYTYAQKTGVYKNFYNICFVDTLENLGFKYKEKQLNAFGLSSENLKRIHNQNSKKISIIITNPPYRANQLNWNQNNKNREYDVIDKRIKNTYVKESKARKPKSYDMYSRFIRWSSDRIYKNGIISFVSNNSYIDGDSYDGFRKVLEREFNEIYIINLKGFAREHGEKRRKEGGNIFNDQIKVGISIFFLIKKEGLSGCTIYYTEIDDYLTSEQKRKYLATSKLETLKFSHIIPNANHDWINQRKEFPSEFIPLVRPEVKTKADKETDRVFDFDSLGISTNRDEWLYDENREDLITKVKYLTNTYNNQIQIIKNSKIQTTIDNIDDKLDYSIKWSDSLINKCLANKGCKFNSKKIIRALKKPFFLTYFYAEKILADRLTINHYKMFGEELEEKNIIITIDSGKNAFSVLASKYLVDLHFNGDCRCFPLYVYDKTGQRQSNISNKFLISTRNYYKDDSITDSDIFCYVYAILHNPNYFREYSLELLKNLPSIPFYEDFWKWSNWGKNLVHLHTEFENIQPLNLKTLTSNKKREPFLKADKEKNMIVINNNLTIIDIPPEAWEYRIREKSAVEWILECYKINKTDQPVLTSALINRQNSDTNYEIIKELILKVANVSIQTMGIINEMKKK